MRGRGEEGMGGGDEREGRRGDGGDEREGRRGEGSGHKCVGYAAVCTKSSPHMNPMLTSHSACMYPMLS